jgi:hypothetical protein
VFRLYNYLFEHIENTKDSLKRDRGQAQSVKSLVDALDAGLNKLKDYYGKTNDKGGTLYSLGTILNPYCKLGMYKVRKHLCIKLFYITY